ncbi:response regulator [Lolliginicoccus suaedae]|uniref:response regulator n=1 Tax=Lolliginicoccus suaedae TaxID=2605429 RepID=UPI001CA808EA|nr:response regulator [Lolliginicoccus suaedae]
MGDAMIRVAFIDDDRMLLDGIGSWLAGSDALTVVAKAQTVREFLETLSVQVDVVVLDLFLADGSDPAENVANLVEAGHKVLVVSVTPQATHGIDVVRAGASGYLTKDNDLATLTSAIEVVASGEMAYSPELAFAWARDDRPSKPRLSPQERAVLLDYATGLTLEVAARRAGVKTSTAKSYLDRVKMKYAQVGRPANTKLDLATRVREDGLHRDSRSGSE